MQAFSVEHIEPLHLGGATTLDNLALACQGCDNHKYTKTEGRDPVSGDSVPLFNPRQQRWREHVEVILSRVAAKNLLAVGERDATRKKSQDI